jgi:hypothetical protein
VLILFLQTGPPGTTKASGNSPAAILAFRTYERICGCYHLTIRHVYTSGGDPMNIVKALRNERKVLSKRLSALETLPSTPYLGVQ